MRLVLFVLIFVSLVIYVIAYFLIYRFRTSSLSIYGDSSKNLNKILRIVRPESLPLHYNEFLWLHCIPIYHNLKAKLWVNENKWHARYQIYQHFLEIWRWKHKKDGVTR